MASTYSSTQEALQILNHLTVQFRNDPTSFPPEIASRLPLVLFTADRDAPYFPMPFKQTETASALKAIEGSVAALLAGVPACLTINLEKTTAFLFQTYLAKVDGLGKLDEGVKRLLKDTDLLRAQSDAYRRMSANLYETKRAGEYYHIHGSLEASTTLRMLGLEPFRPDLTKQGDIVDVIEAAVKRFTVEELEGLNARYRQAGVQALMHEDFLATPHGRANSRLPPWSVENLESETPRVPLKPSPRVLSGIKVIELCRIIAGPTIGRILAEYGAEVIKVTSPSLSDVPFFQVDCNMGKRTVDIDLKTPQGRHTFQRLLADADILLDGYRPGAIDRLGYGVEALTRLARERGKGIIYINENCFGYEGEWADRPGWQQIADCVSGVAWEQGRFMGLHEPIVPPFPISDYGTGCMGAITALIGLYHRAARGGSWHGKASLLHYDLLLFQVGLLPAHVQEELRASMGPEWLDLRHADSVDKVSGTTLRRMREVYPEFMDHKRFLDHWHSHAYGARVSAVLPVVEIDGLDISFQRASRPNGSDEASWDEEEMLDTRCPA